MTLDYHCGDAHKVQELDSTGKIVWELNETDLPGITLRLMAGCHRLPNGNTIFCVYLGHGHIGEQAQFLEVTRDKKVVWEVTDSLRSTDNFSWTGTLMTFELTSEDNQTLITFTYDGPVHENEKDRLAGGRFPLRLSDTATGIRTPVSGLRIRRPSPLDDSGRGRAV